MLTRARHLRSTSASAACSRVGLAAKYFLSRPKAAIFLKNSPVAVLFSGTSTKLFQTTRFLYGPDSTLSFTSIIFRPVLATLGWESVTTASYSSGGMGSKPSPESEESIRSPQLMEVTNSSPSALGTVELESTTLAGYRLPSGIISLWDNERNHRILRQVRDVISF